MDWFFCSFGFGIRILLLSLLYLLLLTFSGKYTFCFTIQKVNRNNIDLNDNTPIDHTKFSFSYVIELVELLLFAKHHFV